MIMSKDLITADTETHVIKDYRMKHKSLGTERTCGVNYVTQIDQQKSYLENEAPIASSVKFLMVL